MNFVSFFLILLSQEIRRQRVENTNKYLCCKWQNWLLLCIFFIEKEKIDRNKDTHKHDRKKVHVKCACMTNVQKWNSFTDCGAHTNAGKMAKQLISALGALANGHSISVSLFNSCVCSVVFTRISLNTLSFKFQLKIPNVAGICFVWLVFFLLSSSPFFRHRFNPQGVHWNHNQCVTCCSGDLQTPPKMSIHSISN